VFWVISVYFNIRNTLPKSGTFLLGHPVYNYSFTSRVSTVVPHIKYEHTPKENKFWRKHPKQNLEVCWRLISEWKRSGQNPRGMWKVNIKMDVRARMKMGTGS